MSNNIVGRNLLEQVVGSYLGALIQREHIKNKRFSDFIDTTAAHERKNLDRFTDRVSQQTGGSIKADGVEIAPAVEYGEMQRQLGVTTFPAPPQSVSINSHDQNSSENYEAKQTPEEKTLSQEEQFEKLREELRKELAQQNKSVNPVPPPPPEEGSFFPGNAGVGSVEAKKKGFPWWQTAAATLLAGSVATNGYLVYKSSQNSPPANGDTSILIEDPSMGSVGLTVE